MIELITGLPGNCKTLYTIAYVREWAKRENRPVFYSGIPELKLDWTAIEPENWMECPTRSIVVIDECQRVFRNRSLGAQPPKHVTDLETHRHLGIDLVFITQHPSLIDPAIRRLAGKHKHMIRIWGFEASTVHAWDAVRDNCDKPAGRKDSEQSKWKFDKSVYGLYKSADAHTMKARLPTRLKLLIALPFVLLALGWVAYHFAVGKGKQPAPAVAANRGPGQTADMAAVPVVAQQVKFDPVADAREFVWKNTPRVSELPYTAPKYDQLTQPTSAPRIAACVMMGDRCSCYTQQGTRLQGVAKNTCLDIVSNGAFSDFSGEREGQNERLAKATEALDTVERLPLSGSATRDVGSSNPTVAQTASNAATVEGFRPTSGVRKPVEMAP